MRTFAARFCLLHWLALSFVLTVMAFVAADWDESVRAWNDLADLGITPLGILTSIALGWGLHAKFWLCAGLAAGSSTALWLICRRSAVSRYGVKAEEPQSIHIARARVETKPLVFQKTRPTLR